MLFENILGKIGGTPLIRINRMNPNKQVPLYAKIEGFNPGGSVKDRIALSMITAAEKSGELTQEKIVLEATSGNTGIGLAMVCAVKGYRCHLVMPESASIERRKIMRSFGAEIILTPAKRSTDGAIEKAYAMAREFPERYYLTDQFNNAANWQAHYETTGPEIWQQTEGRVTDVIATLGTTGTAMGLCRFFADHHPEVRVIAMEPFYDHKIQGLKNMKESYRPGIFDKSLPHEIVHVGDEIAFDTARRLAREEGIFVGMSSGAAMSAAIKRIATMDSGFVVVLLPDGGEKYLSTILFDEQKSEELKVSRLRFYNSMTRKKEVFQPGDSKQVTFYACGPTAHEMAHLGHCRRFLVADLIHRCLLNKGFAVRFCMNFTDLDDNTIAGAEKAGKSLAEFTEQFIEAFKQDIRDLGVLEAEFYPKASQHVNEMIKISQDLIAKGYAYEKHGSVYFDISKFPKYGRMSGVDISKIKHGRTVDLDNYEKDNPVDFTLLKRSTLNELKRGIFYKTDYGNVRPGWHVECAVMSLHYLNATIDIHTSSRDLIFPHHENEIAIAEALAGKPLARYWLHSELLLIGGKKMAAESGNIITLKDLQVKGYSAREIRFFLLCTHYRKSINFSYSRLDAARNSLRRFDNFICRLLCLPSGLPHPDIASYVSEMEKRFFEALDDDLNISEVLAALFSFMKKANPVLYSGLIDREQKQDILEALGKINQIINVLRLDGCQLSPDIDTLIQQREEARHNKDWQRADEVRDALLGLGISLMDTAKGPVWKKLDLPIVPPQQCQECKK